MQEPSALYAAALAYAAAGIPVFPCLPLSKVPAVAGGFHAATVDPALINAWWSGDPNYNVAFSPGHLGWGALDTDPAKGKTQDGYMALPAEAHEGEPTWTVRTPRGGHHHYYRGHVPTTAGTLYPGFAVDTRGQGSYALLPPSSTPDGAYSVAVEADIQPVPEWLAERIRTVRTKSHR